MPIFKRPWSSLFFCLALGALGGITANAQTVTGDISGVVVDASGAIIPAAAVKLVDEQTGFVRTLTTNEDGRFGFAGIQPGVYTVKVERQGFETLERKNIVLSANETLALGELELKPGQVSETVIVTSAGAAIETESSDLTARLTSDEISLISTKGRDITSLLRLLPGTSYIDDIEAVGEGFGTDLPNISGQRGRSTVVTVDGLNGSEPSGSNKLSMTINQDAVGEVKVLRNNYAAEYGNNGGAMINIVSKGGKKDYAGTAYYFIRNEALNANDFFSNKSGLPRGLYRHNIWGFNFGGPVKLPKLFPNRDRNKLFFFYSLEEPHTITPQNARFVTVPTALERQGDFSQSINSSNAKVFVRDPLITTGNCSATDQTACFRDPSRATSGNPSGLNIIPRARWNSSGLAILNFFPLPNQPAGNLFNYIVKKSVDVPKWSQVIRGDVRPTDKDSLYLKLQWWTSDNEGFQTSGWPGGSPPDANTWGISSHYLYRDNGLAMNWVRVISPNIVNDATLGLRHDSEGFVPSTGVIGRLSRKTLNYAAPQLFPDNNRLGTIPRVTGWSSVAGRPANINWLDRWGEIGQDYILPSIADNITFNRGNHTYKAGLYLERLRNGEAAGGNWSGTFNFGTSSSFTSALGNTGYAYANALVGDFNSYTETSSRPHTNLETTIIQWYGQDQWKVNRRLTINYGLRLGYHTQWFQRDRLASNFDRTRFDPSKAPLVYLNGCTVSPIPATGCPNSSRRAMDPRTGQLFTNAALVGSFVPGTGDPNNGLALASDPTTTKGFKDVQPLDWEPRVGFAWDTFGKGKTVLRAMSGVYHAPRVGGGTTGGNLVNNPPFQRSLTINFGNIDQLVNLTGTALNRPSTINAVEARSNTPTTYNFSLGVQQELGFKTAIEVAYVGSLSRHLGERRNINSVPDGARFLSSNRDPVTNSVKPDDLLRPYQGYGAIDMVMYSGSSNYNGLQVQVFRRYTRGFQFGIAYTYSKTFDYANDDSSDVSFPRPYRAFNYGPADFDQTHIFTVHYIWDVPGLSRYWNNGFVKAIFDGWQLSGITSLVSGKPKSVSVTYNSGTVTATGLPAITDFTGGSVNARPNMICNPNRQTGAVDATGTPVLIDTSCFTKPAHLSDIGNTPRNVLRLPGVVNFDLASFKNIRLGEKRSLQFRWETYNLFNRTNFADIDASMTFDANGVQTHKAFGVPTSARSPRVMQGSLRFSF